MVSKVKTIKRGRLRALSSHKVLDHLAQELIEGLSPQFSPMHWRVLIYVGLHLDFRLRRFSLGYKIGIQTEHFYDENGVRLWACKKAHQQKKLIKNVKACDLILDTNPQNYRFYEEIGLGSEHLKKIHYGPFLFPSQKVAYVAPKENSALFFGFMNPRREQFLKTLSNPPYVMSDSKFGVALYRQISAYEGIANIHFGDGVYTEVPRLLTAYNCGKPVISERLQSPFEMGVHYADIENYDPQLLPDIYENFSNLITENYTFEAFLRKHSV